MHISALNFFWLTDPQDLQSIPTSDLDRRTYPSGTYFLHLRVSCREDLPHNRVNT